MCDLIEYCNQMTRKTYYEAQYPEEDDMTAYAATPNMNGEVEHRGLKRQHSARTLWDEPHRKERATEEKMVARLRGFHITPRSEQSNNWFFMRPQETFEQIESRLVDSDDEDDMEDRKGESSEEAPVKLSPELAELIAKQKEAFGPAIRQPRNDMQVVVWTPRGDFVQDVVNKANMGPQITELEDGEELDDQDAPAQPQFVTFPDVDEVDNIASDIHVRKRRISPNRPDRERCSSTFFIQEIPDESGESAKEMECD